MEMNIPKIEALGFIVENVQDKKVSERWFNHRGIWFDARLERTGLFCFFFAKKYLIIILFLKRDICCMKSLSLKKGVQK